jgi:serine/threonine-protein kinase
MGEVYRARDTRLDRSVAVKILPPAAVSDPSLRARFEREARAVSSLDHPNICVVHDVGREGNLEYLVMQYLEGETLAARLARGPLPLDEALRYAVEIAGALSTAHRAGILHRDLKPGNVMLARSAAGETSAKLLDFGLAKIINPGPVLPTGHTATVAPITGQGTILGTLLYMPPEQLEGRDADARSDIFAFGAVLYEMVTGTRAFDASSQASIIAAILEREPAPISSRAPLTPPALDRVVRKCLAKNPDRRWQSAADLCDELTWIAQSSAVIAPVTGAHPVVSRRPRLWPWLAATAAAALLAIGAYAWANRDRGVVTTRAAARHFSIDLPDGVEPVPGGMAISPDGMSIVFVAASVAADGGRTSRLYLRRLDAPAAIPLEGTEDARTPFFAADGATIGYLTETALMKISVGGAKPVMFSGAPPVSRGCTWLPDETVVCAPTQSTPLFRVTSGAQLGTPVTTLDSASGEQAHLFPEVLPGGKHILFMIRRGSAQDVDVSDIAVADVDTGKHQVVMRGAAFPRYATSGHLLFVRSGSLYAVGFDTTAQRVSGSPVLIAGGIAVHSDVGGAHYAVSSDGSLAFFSGTFPRSQSTPVFVDRAGTVLGTLDFAKGFSGPRLSPDGSRAVFAGRSPDGDAELFLADLRRANAIRTTTAAHDDFNPLWTHDGRRLIWTTFPPGRLPTLVARPVDGGQPKMLLDEPMDAHFGGSVSTDNVLAFTRVSQAGRADIWTLPLDGNGSPRPVIESPADEFGPEFSPNGKWLAYVSDESSSNDIYVVRYPSLDAKRRVTSSGGAGVAWNRNGRELFYQAVLENSPPTAESIPEHVH